MGISIVFEALRRERMLPDPVAWKIAGIVSMVVVGAVNTLYPLPITMDQIVTLIGVLFAIYTQVATTKQIGFAPKGGSSD